jgi:hypothetical protein
MANVAHADRIATLNKLLDEKGQDYRGIVVTMIHKFRDMPAKLNTRKNIFVLIDEAHRTTGGDLGNFLMAGLPNASFIGFTGTPVDKTVYGKGTFKTFGCEDDKGCTPPARSGAWHADGRFACCRPPGRVAGSGGFHTAGNQPVLAGLHRHGTAALSPPSPAFLGYAPPPDGAADRSGGPGFASRRQANYTTGSANRGSTTKQNSVSGPVGVAYDATNTRLFVADDGAYRVTVYNVATGTIANGENASNELGQPSVPAAYASVSSLSYLRGVEIPTK